MLADDVASAQCRETDRSGFALAGDAFTRIDAVVAQLDARAGGSGLAEPQCGTGRRIDLVPMVHLDHLDVERRSELAGGLLDEPREHRDADAHVRREHDGNRLRMACDLGLPGDVESRRADDGRDARLRAGFERLPDRLRDRVFERVLLGA